MQMMDSAKTEKADLLRGGGCTVVNVIHTAVKAVQSMTGEFILGSIMFAAGVLLAMSTYEFRDSTYLKSVDADCRIRYGDSAKVVYNPRQNKFMCWKGK